jgi:murein L,D-transpeptidase YafK
MVPAAIGRTRISEVIGIDSELDARLGAARLRLGAPAHIRIYKRESILELWLEAEGRGFVLFKSYPICAWSGTLGPKLQEGDRQSPEGFYRVTLSQLNPNSRHRLAFNIGYPNAYDLSLGRTGSAIMVHGGCSSAGCFAMTDDGIEDIYPIVEAALRAGQPTMDVAIFPFRLTETALQLESGSPWIEFWRNLREESKLFEAGGRPVAVAAAGGRYCFGANASASGATPIVGWV